MPIPDSSASDIRSHALAGSVIRHPFTYRRGPRSGLSSFAFRFRSASSFGVGLDLRLNDSIRSVHKLYALRAA
jgi:hypothetical protein